MDNSQHTPGPWVQVGLEIYDDISAHDTSLIARCNARTGWDANARLIAAAPDLLAALQGVMELHWKSCPTDDGRGDGIPVTGKNLIAARVAVAKATGQISANSERDTTAVASVTSA